MFEGPSGLDGGAVLNEAGNFGVTGYSPPNFLAFNTGAVLRDGGIPRGPETIRFSRAVSYVEMLAGSNDGGSLGMQAYDSIGSLVDSESISLSSAMQPVSVSGAGIVRVVVSASASVFVLDDLAL